MPPSHYCIYCRTLSNNSLEVPACLKNTPIVRKKTLDPGSISKALNRSNMIQYANIHKLKAAVVKKMPSAPHKFISVFSPTTSSIASLKVAEEAAVITSSERLYRANGPSCGWGGYGRLWRSSSRTVRKLFFSSHQKKVPKMCIKIPVKKNKLNLVEDKPNL